MTHCAKCGAELIGTRKFCTACGAPAGDPRSPAASTGMAAAAPQRGAPAALGEAPNAVEPSVRYAPAPASQVNPFAKTAGPRSAPASSYGPPPSIPMELASTTPGVGDPLKSPQVSPLATSNVDSQRGAFVNALLSGQSQPESPAGAAARPPGTQLMPSVANPNAAAVPTAPQASAKRPERTQLLGAFPGVPAGAGEPPVLPHPVAAPAPPPPPAPQHMAPGAAPHLGWNPAPHAAAVAPSYQPHVPAAHPYPAPPVGYGGFAGYAPGARVTVTWSNGQRYPGTVMQMAGPQCLVVFPDGQHHWVDIQFVAPA